MVLSEVNATVLPMFLCPSRRPATVYPYGDSACLNANPSPNNLVQKSDYAANGGTVEETTGYNTPATLDQGDTLNWSSTCPWISTATGVSYCRSQVSAALITDGLSFTFMAGEKLLGGP